MEKPIVDEIFQDNGAHSHWVLINPENGEKLWSEEPAECLAMGHPVKSDIAHGFKKFNLSNIPEGEPVIVRFGNGNILIGKREGGCMSYDAKDLDFDTMMSKEMEFKLTKL